MKSWKLVTSALLVLLGFCAGVGLNFAKMSATVQGASGPPEPPPAALKSVAHNATLAGDGTTTTPLGIANGGVGTPQVASGAIGSGQLANGAVTAPKIAAGSPGPGQVLSYNGTAMSWQTPAAFLNSVSHDPTLSGDGTGGSPLGVANGGVTAPKLSTSAIPSAGQVLGFNGANLAWQNAPVGGVKLVDSLGHDVGPMWGGVLLRRIGNLTIALNVGATGFIRSNESEIGGHFTTPDCSGTRYWPRSADELVSPSVLTITHLLVATSAPRQVTIRSYLSAMFDGSRCWGPNRGVTPISEVVSEMTAMDFSNLGLTPPFHLEF